MGSDEESDLPRADRAPVQCGVLPESALCMVSAPVSQLPLPRLSPLLFLQFSPSVSPLQIRTFINGYACVLSHVQLFATLWTRAHQAPLSVGFPRQECWSGLSFPPPGHLPDPGIERASPACSASAGGFFTTSTTWKALNGRETQKGRGHMYTHD